MATSTTALSSNEIAGMRLRRPVRDLGEQDARLSGIWSPGFSEQEISLHVHELFLTDPEAYLKFCPVNQASIEHWRGLIQTALDGYQASTILDIGSGGGVSVFPAVALFPAAQVVATDLALPLLSELRNLARRDRIGSLHILQMNAEDMVIADAQADLVMGANILHHAYSLETMFAEIRRVLRPGGKAVFWEAFENGAQLLSALFDTWLEMSPHQSEPLSPQMINSLESYLRDIERRVGRNKSAQFLADADDKWIFTAGHLRDLAKTADFTGCALRNIYGSHDVIRVLGDHELRRKGHSYEELPAWAQTKLLAAQARCSADFLAENPFCCSIVLTA